MLEFEDRLCGSGNGVTYMPTAKWIVSANHEPKFSDHSLGLWERGRFPKADELPTKVRACIGRAKTESDVVRGWADDQGVQVVSTKEGWMPKAKLYSQFTQWCEEQGRRAVAQPEFFKRLERIFPRQIQEEQRRSAGQTRTRWVNLKMDMGEVAF